MGFQRYHNVSNMKFSDLAIIGQLGAALLTYSDFVLLLRLQFSPKDLGEAFNMAWTLLGHLKLPNKQSYQSYDIYQIPQMQNIQVILLSVNRVELAELCVCEYVCLCVCICVCLCVCVLVCVLLFVRCEAFRLLGYE